ncbi:MAG: hypothetical protein IKN75_02095 [Prevotella sp.]|nr:hypothetical protein [Prevotella sp.]
MIFVRELIYRENTLDDFEIDSNESVFKLFFDLLLSMDGTRVTDMDAENKITDMFNDACFICNAAIQINRPYMQYGEFYKIASGSSIIAKHYTPVPNRGDIVMCLVYFLLEEHGDDSTALTRLKSIIETDINKRSKENNNCFSCFSNAYYNSGPTYLQGNFVVKLPITKDVLSRVCWSDISNNYDMQCLKDIVLFWNNPKERNFIIDDIESEIKQNMEPELPF